MVWLYWAVALTLVTWISAKVVKRWPHMGLATLVAFYCLYLALSQILATRIVAFPLGFYTLYAPGAVFLYPFVAQAIDMINETYGFKAAQGAIFIAFLTQVLMVLLILLVRTLPPAPFFGLEESWQKIFSQGVRITGASWAAFLICQLVDARIFSWLKARYPEKAWLRSMGSDLLNLTLDSILFVILAFWGIAPVGTLILGQVFSKNLIGFLDTPWFLWYRRLLGKEEVALGQAE
ncbi:MAG: VUT family protein [Deltaproteobacteria bacterium]|nr:MAG: VUT family protein [Deltaproteobacteria bacterium]